VGSAAEFFQHFLNGLTLGGIYALIALGYTMVYGILKFINFAHGEILMVGAYVGPVFSAIGMTIAPRAQAEKIVMISPSTTHADFPGIGDYIFRTTPSDGLQAEVSGSYFANELGIKRLAVLYVKNDYSQGLYESVADVFEANGGEIVAVESALQGDKDFKTQLTSIRSADPEAIYIPNYVAEMAQILEQAANLGIDATFLSADGFTNPEIFDLAGEYTNGVIYTGPVEAEATAAAASFVQDYSDKWGVEPDFQTFNFFCLTTCEQQPCCQNQYT